MSAVSWIAVPLVVAWLATLIMLPDLHRVSWLDFAIAAAGAGMAAALLQYFGVPLTGPNGMSAWSTLGCSCGATAPVTASNVVRYGRLRSEPPKPRSCWRQSLHGWEPGSSEP
jgi:uncharacterized membrane protein YeaQ/YmgE (transglycosylase-associated protein family)